MQRGLLAHGVAAAEAIGGCCATRSSKRCDTQVPVEQLEGLPDGALRPPQGDSQGEADGEQEQGVEVGELLEAWRVSSDYGTARPQVISVRLPLMTKAIIERRDDILTLLRLRRALARYKRFVGLLGHALISRSGVSSAMPQLKVQRRSVGCAG